MLSRAAAYLLDVCLSTKLSVCLSEVARRSLKRVLTSGDCKRAQCPDRLAGLAGCLFIPHPAPRASRAAMALSKLRC